MKGLTEMGLAQVRSQSLKRPLMERWHLALLNTLDHVTADVIEEDGTEKY